MSSVVKNIIILIFFVVFYNTVVKADDTRYFETTGHAELFFTSLPDSQMVNFDSVVQCELRRWTECQVC